MGPLTAVHRKLDEIKLSGEPIIRIEVVGGIRFDLVERSKRVLGENASGIHDPQVQHRLAKLHATQIREIERIKGYAEHKPQMLSIHAIGPEGPSFSLSPTSPPELLALAKKYATHPLALELVRRARSQSALPHESTDQVVSDSPGRSKLGPFDQVPLSPPPRPPRTDALVKKADSEPRVDRRPTPHAKNTLEVSRVETASSPPPRGAELSSPGSLGPAKLLAASLPKSLDRLAEDERILFEAAQQNSNAATLSEPIEPRQSAPGERAMSVETRREYEGSTPSAGDTEDAHGSGLNGAEQDPASPLAHTFMSKEEREDFLRPRVLGNNRASADIQPKDGETANISAWDHLSRLPFDRDMVRLRQLYDQYEGAKSEPEKRRFAYLLNREVNVSLTERTSHPILCQIFDHSDQHLEWMKREAQKSHFSLATDLAAFVEVRSGE